MASMADKVIVLRSEYMGQGSDSLGQVILASFLRLLAESHEKPRAIFLYNGGVKLLTDESPVLALLQELAEKGIPIQACKTCVDSFGIRETMKAGELSTMAQFVEYVATCEIVTL